MTKRARTGPQYADRLGSPSEVGANIRSLTTSMRKTRCPRTPIMSP